MPIAKTNPGHKPKNTEHKDAVIPEENNDYGAIRLASGVISTIVRRAACSIPGVTRISGNSLVDNIAEFVGSRKVLDRAIQIEIDHSTVAVTLSINICYGVSLPKIAADVQQAVSNQIQELTGLEVSQVNVIIREMEDVASDEDSEDDEE
ncbi:MAG: Asp23/Gls24 family envelope stress response protein [Lentisphaeria bacterium]|nr:Asp23/Gls24 family envelope stress response protein [Lentisphaeria bacterium]